MCDARAPGPLGALAVTALAELPSRQLIRYRIFRATVELDGAVEICSSERIAPSPMNSQKSTSSQSSARTL